MSKAPKDHASLRLCAICHEAVVRDGRVQVRPTGKDLSPQLWVFHRSCYFDYLTWCAVQVNPEFWRDIIAGCYQSDEYRYRVARVSVHKPAS